MGGWYVGILWTTFFWSIPSAMSGYLSNSSSKFHQYVVYADKKYICMYIYIYTHISEAVVSFRWRSGNIFLFTRIAYSFYAAEYNLLRVDNTTPSKQTISNYPPRWREGGWGVNNSAMRGRWPIRFMENRFSSLIMNAYRAYRREFIFCVKWTVFDIPKI